MAAALLVLLQHAAFAAEPGGTVKSVKPGMWAMRDNVTVPLEEGSDVYEFDIIQTNEGGSGEIQFKDDSVLEIGSNSEVDLRQLVFTNNRKRMDVGVLQGVARVVSGGIIKINPKFMKLTTPKSSIGIRGTIVKVEETSEKETVTGESLEEGHFITVTNNRTFQVGSISGEGGSITTRDDNEMTVSGLAQIGMPSRRATAPPISSAAGGGGDGRSSNCRDSNTTQGNRKN
jgi:hypothetical protein